MGRLIAIGDVHGCWAELQELLDFLKPTADDEVLFLGDLVNRGPDSQRVIEIARRINGRSLLGNHEHRLLQYYWLRDPNILKDYDFRTLESFTETEWSYLKRMRLTYYAREYNTLFVHGGLLPDVPWAQQTVSVVTRIQVIDSEGEARKRGECPNGTPWDEIWPGPEFVVYGHWPRREEKRTNNTLGIDTACAHGGHLTAYILPEKQIYQVKAHRTYWPKTIS